MTLRPEDERPTELGDIPTEEGVSEADAADRAELSPEQQQNYPETSSQPVGEPPQFEHLTGTDPGGEEQH